MKMNESYEMTFTLKDADMIKLAEIFGYTNINNCPYFEIQDKYGNSAKYYRENPPSVQPESTADAEFWRKRADYYSDMCSKLIADMGAGVKIEAVKIDETGITFTKKKPSAQPEIIACGDCKHWICHERLCGYWNHGVNPLMWCSQAERREE